jgi:hypothetical protein
VDYVLFCLFDSECFLPSDLSYALYCHLHLWCVISCYGSWVLFYLVQLDGIPHPVCHMWQPEPLNRNESGRFGALKSDSTHHFFRNVCTKLGSLRFSQFSGCWLILSVYIIMSFDFPCIRLFGAR